MGREREPVERVARATEEAHLRAQISKSKVSPALRWALFGAVQRRCVWSWEATNSTASSLRAQWGGREVSRLHLGGPNIECERCDFRPGEDR